MQREWKNIDYLLNIGEKQKKTYDIITDIGILEILEKYNPILVGTIPIDIDIDKSDIDIACEVYDFNEFKKIVIELFHKYKNFTIDIRNEREREFIVANFYIEEMEIEIYGEALPVEKQNGYRHMIIEYRILKIGGRKLKEEIIKLKKAGLKTEPAFAKCLDVYGDPYEELLKLENKDDNYLRKLIL